jgi:hypothetical protein
MALESATYVNQLNPAFPASTDLLAQGDDHIRLIKAVLQATFPNINGPVTLTQAQLNGISAAHSGGGRPHRRYHRLVWLSASVPAGWHICDGTTGIARSDGAGTIDVPDLRNLVIMGAGTVAAQGTRRSARRTNRRRRPRLARIATRPRRARVDISTRRHRCGPRAHLSEMPAHDHLNGVGGGNPGTGGGSRNRPMQTTSADIRPADQLLPHVGGLDSAAARPIP